MAGSCPESVLTVMVAVQLNTEMSAAGVMELAFGRIMIDNDANASLLLPSPIWGGVFLWLDFLF